jgi:hypothetical protein
MHSSRESSVFLGRSGPSSRCILASAARSRAAALLRLSIRFVALFAAVWVSFSSTPAAHAQPAGTCEDLQLRDCCNGVTYWTGYNPQTATTEGPNTLTSFESYWSQNGYLDESVRSRNVWTFVSVFLTILLLVGLFWLLARRQLFPGWVQLLLLLIFPGLVWYLVPDCLAKNAAKEKSDIFVAGTLRKFCTGMDGSLDDAQTAPCSALSWPAFFRLSDVADARTPTVACERLGSGDVDGILKDPDNACSTDCATAMDAASPGGGPNKLRERSNLIQNDLLRTCSAVADNWRSPTGPTPADWRACSSALAARSVKRQISSNWVHEQGWAGLAFAAVFAGLFFITLRRV